MIKMDIARLFRDSRAFLGYNVEVLLVIAALFFMLPSIGMNMSLSTPPIPTGTPSAAQLDLVAIAVRNNWPWIFGSTLLYAFGSLTIWRFLLIPQSSVGDAMRMAGRLVIPYFVASMVIGIGVGMGLLLLIVPGVYIYVRMLLAGPHIAANAITNPLTALGGAWRVMRGNVFWLWVAMMIFILVGSVSMSVINKICTGLIGMMLEKAYADLANGIIFSALTAVLSLCQIIIAAAAYQQVRQATAASG